MSKQTAPIIYLDHAATTYVAPEVLEAMLPYFSDKFGNAESMHKKGFEAKEAIDRARQTTAQILNCKPSEIIFTGSGTGSNNLAILGTAKANKNKGKHIITTKIEHSSVTEPFKKLSKEGFEVTFLDVDQEGFINLQTLKKELRPDTILVSVIYANNEIGTIQSIKKISEILSNTSTLFHTDACQAAGALSLDTDELKIDLMTINGSKIYGPKGIGALYIKKGTTIEPIIFGGNHESGLHSGTQNTPLIVGFAKALELAQKNSQKENERLTKLRKKFINDLTNKIPTSKLNGPIKNRLPNNINIRIPYTNSKDLLFHLNEAGIYASSGSSCNSKNDTISPTLKAIGLSDTEAQSSIRITLGKKTTKESMDYTIKTLTKLSKSLSTR